MIPVVGGRKTMASGWFSLAAVLCIVPGCACALPNAHYQGELQNGLLMRPFDTEVSTGSYWLTRLKSRHMAPAMELFRDWILAEAGGMRLAA